MYLTDPDNGQVLQLLRKELVKLKTGEKVVESTVATAHVTLEDESYSLGTRKLAAQLSLRLGHSPDVASPVWMAALLEEGRKENIVAALHAWNGSFHSRGANLADDVVFALFSTLVLKCAKLKKQLAVPSSLFDVLVPSVLLCAECRPEDVSHLTKAVVKTVCVSEDDYDRWLLHCVCTLPADLHSKYLLISMLLCGSSDAGVRSALSPLLSHLESSVAEQSSAGQAAPALIALLQRTLGMEEEGQLVYHMVKTALTNVDSQRRVNSARYWAGRAATVPQLRALLVRMAGEMREECVRGGAETDAVYPCGVHVEDVSCVDAWWRWRETEEQPMWPRDALLSACIHLIACLTTKSASCVGEADVVLLRLAIKWHIEAVRLAAWQLCRTLLSPAEIEEFVLLNARHDGELGDAVLAVAKKVMFSPASLDRLRSMLSSGTKEEQRLALEVLPVDTLTLWSMVEHGEDDVRRKAVSLLHKEDISHLGDDIVAFVQSARWCERAVDCVSLVGDRVEGVLEWLEKEGGEWEDKRGKALIMARLVSKGQVGKEKARRLMEKAGQTVEELLRIGGSNGEDSCPTLPQLNDHLEKEGWTAKSYANTLSAMLSLVHQLSVVCDETSEAARLCWQTAIRCRHKAVVDTACSLMHTLFGLMHTVHGKTGEEQVKKYFDMALSLLCSPHSFARSLSLTRILWTCCEIRTHNFGALWSVVDGVLEASSHPLVTARCLKLLKFFLSKANHELPDSCHERLLFYCIDAQTESDDFLVRSAATILFGFVCLRVCERRRLPLAVLWWKRNSLCRRLLDALSQVDTVPSARSVLLLTLVSRLQLASECVCCEELLCRVDGAHSAILRLLEKTPEERIKRFCVDALLSLTPFEGRQAMGKEMLGEGKTKGMEYLAAELDGSVDAMPYRSGQMPTDVLEECGGVRMLSELREWMEEGEGDVDRWLERIEHHTRLDWEVSAQTRAVALAIVADRARHDQKWRSMCEGVLLHSRSRVRSLASRVGQTAGGFLQAELVIQHIYH